MNIIESQLVDKLNDISWDIENRKIMQGYGKRSFDDIIKKKFEMIDFIFNKFIREQDIEKDISKKHERDEKITNFKNKISNLKLKFNDFKEKQLYPNLSEQNTHSDFEGKNILHENTNLLKESSNRISKMNEIIIDTEKLSINVSSQLMVDGERIKKQLEVIEGVEVNVNRSKSIIGRMGRNQILQSIILVLIMIAFILFIGTFVYFSVKKWFDTISTNKS